MRIGIFDSGLGGLIIAKAIKKAMPEYDYVYLGDTKRVPYGNRSHETVFEFTKQAVDYLFRKENCAIVIVACNTASARALRRIQQEYLPELNFTPSLRPRSEHSPLAGGEKTHLTPDPSPERGEGKMQRRVLGVLIPTAEECAKYNRVGIIGTNGTIASNTFVHEISKINSKTKIFQNPAPMLVPLAEEGEKVLAKPFIVKYLKPFLGKPRRSLKSGSRPQASGKIEALALGCTHYPFFKAEIRKILPKNIRIISQDEIVPKKLKEYFKRHPELEKQLSRGKTPDQSKARYGAGNMKILLTEITPNIENLSKKWFGKDTKPELIRL